MSKRCMPDGDSVVNTPQERRDLLNDLQRVLRVAFLKYENERCKNSERLGWGRLIIGAVDAAGGIIRDADIDSLLRRVEVLEEMKQK